MAEDKGRNVRSQLLQEAKLVLKAYADSQEFEKDVEAGRLGVFDKIKDRLMEDMDAILRYHPVLLAKIAGWKGDLEEAMGNAKDRSAEAIGGLIRQMDTFEGRATAAWTTIQAFDKELPGLVQEVISKGGMQSPEGKQKLLEELRAVNSAFDSWVVTDRQVETVILHLRSKVEEFKALSVRLNNYWGAGFDLDGLIKGTGMFAGQPNIADRYRILVRRIRDKPDEYRKSPAVLKKVNAFFYDYVKSQKYHTGEPWLLPEEVEQTKTDLQYYDQAVSGHQQRGCTRHLYPWEAFTIMFDSMENPLSIYGSIGQDMRRGNGEWTALSFMKQGNTLHIAENVTNLKWNGRDYELQGKEPNGKLLVSQPQFPEEVNDWVRINMLPVSFVQMMWGKTPDELKKYDAKTFIWTDNVWRPVARGIYDFSFYLFTNYIQGASRGVRRK